MEVSRMPRTEPEWTRIGSICDGLAKYGIDAVPSATRPSWLVIRAPLAVSSEGDLLGTPEAPEVFVSDADLLRLDSLEVVLGKVTSVVGHPC
jgi:hypothetical protein